MAKLNVPTLVGIAQDFYAEELPATRAAELAGELGPMNNLVSALARRLNICDEPADFMAFTEASD